MALEGSRLNYWKKKKEKEQYLTLLHSARPKLYAILASLSAIGLMWIGFSAVKKVAPNCFLCNQCGKNSVESDI